MAKIWITEYRGVGRMADAVTPAPLLPELRVQTVTFTGSTPSADAFAKDCSLIRLYADAACHVAFGTAPTATTDSTPLAAGTEMFLAIAPNGTTKVAAVAA